MASSFLISVSRITGEIGHFCNDLSAQPPQLVKLVPFPGCDGDAFANLPGQIARFGGTVLAGWRIHVWPRVLIQAQPHMIWHSPKDEWIDVTAAPDRAAQSLFVPDPQVTAQTVSRRHPLVRDGLLDRWLALDADGQNGKAAMDAFVAVVRRFAKPNDPCWCGSGRQMRKCHRLDK